MPISPKYSAMLEMLYKAQQIGLFVLVWPNHGSKSTCP
jgi:hypothetical protein